MMNRVNVGMCVMQMDRLKVVEVENNEICNDSVIEQET